MRCNHLVKAAARNFTSAVRVLVYKPFRTSISTYVYGVVFDTREHVTRILKLASGERATHPDFNIYGATDLIYIFHMLFAVVQLLLAVGFFRWFKVNGPRACYALSIVFLLIQHGVYLHRLHLAYALSTTNARGSYSNIVLGCTVIFHFFHDYRLHHAFRCLTIHCAVQSCRVHRYFDGRGRWKLNLVSVGIQSMYLMYLMYTYQMNVSTWVYAVYFPYLASEYYAQYIKQNA
jgi:hypothetical protein